MRHLNSVAAAGLLLLLGGCERWELDRKMKELCKKDGGIKVYETVTLPASEFDGSGRPLARYAQQASSEVDLLGPEYRNIVTSEVLIGSAADIRQREGVLKRIHTSIYRRSDGRLLGEQIWYTRIGGDGLTYFGFQPGGESCPQFTRGLARSIFVKGE